MQVHEKLFIGGEWVDPAGSDVIEVISPHTEEVVGRVPEGTNADIDRAVAAARKAFDEGEWPRMTPEERIAAVQRFSDLYAARMMDMAQIITTEMGSPISFAQLAQAPAPWMMLNTFIAEAAKYEWEEDRTGMMGTPVIVRSEGVGVVGAIVPWNVPQFVTMSKLAPALLSGSTIVIKPSPETPLDAMLMAELLEEAGIPKGVVSVIPAGREVGEHLVRHKGVDKIAFTGSTAAGRTIASICGEQLKRVSLELGGKSAAIILDDADLAATMEGLKFASLMNNGQACVAQTRILASRVELRHRGRGAGRDGAGHEGRRSRRPHHRDRPARGRAPAGAGREVHRPRPGRGRPRGGRRQRPARRHQQGLVRAAHRVRRRRPTTCASPRRRSSGPCSR